MKVSNGIAVAAFALGGAWLLATGSDTTAGNLMVAFALIGWVYGNLIP